MLQPIRLLLIFFVLITNIHCNNDSSKTAMYVDTKKQYIDTIQTPKDIKKENNGNKDTISYKSEGYEFVKYDTLLKLPFTPNFQSHKATLYKGALSTIKDYEHNQFRSFSKAEIEQIYQKQKVNFGGHYSLIQYSCSGPCTNFRMIDCRNGKIYEGLDGCGGNFSYQANSNLIIINPMKTNDKGYFTPKDVEHYFPCKSLHQIHIWDDRKKVFKKISALEILFRENGVWIKKIIE